MQIFAPPVKAIADRVWTDTTRTLTADPASLTEVTDRTSLGAGVLADYRPSGTAMRILSAGGGLGATGIECGLYDGTNFDSADAGTNVAVTMTGGATRGPALFNSGSSAYTSAVAGWDQG